MQEILIVTKNKDALADFARRITANPANLTWADSGAATVEAAKNRKIDLVIIDRDIDDISPKDLVTRLMMVNAMIYTALISDLSEEDFHEATEGLGILMRLPVDPKAEAAEKLMQHLQKVMGLG